MPSHDSLSLNRAAPGSALARGSAPRRTVVGPWGRNAFPGPLAGLVSEHTALTPPSLPRLITAEHEGQLP